MVHHGAVVTVLARIEVVTSEIGELDEAQPPYHHRKLDRVYSASFHETEKCAFLEPHVEIKL